MGLPGDSKGPHWIPEEGRLPRPLALGGGRTRAWVTSRGVPARLQCGICIPQAAMPCT